MVEYYEKYTNKNFLDGLSYTSKFTQSLKQISLSKTSLTAIIEDVDMYRNGFTYKFSVDESLIGVRFKSANSIQMKIKRIATQGGGFKQCFNDILGFRLHIHEYPESFPDYFRVVNMKNGKVNDDGYRGIHLYYQRDNHSYPIEIQLWNDIDYEFNTWTHKYLYKTRFSSLGKQLRKEYDEGTIKDLQTFIVRLNEMREGVGNYE